MSGHDPKGPPPESVPPMTAMPPTGAETRAEAYLVVIDSSGLFAVYFDALMASAVARELKGVVCAVPITADFRDPGSEPRSGTWAQDATEATPTLRAGSVIEVRDPGP